MNVLKICLSRSLDLLYLDTPGQACVAFTSFVFKTWFRIQQERYLLNYDLWNLVLLS